MESLRRATKTIFSRCLEEYIRSSWHFPVQNDRAGFSVTITGQPCTVIRECSSTEDMTECGSRSKALRLIARLVAGTFLKDKYPERWENLS